MKRWITWIVIALLALATALAVAVWLALRTIDLDAITARIEAAVSEATGREFTIGGRPEVTLLPRPLVVIRDVRLANPPGMSRPHALVVPRIRAGVSLASLLTGQGLGVRIEVSEPDVLLERDDKGVGNWNLVVPMQDFVRDLVQALGAVAEYARFDALVITDGRVAFHDRKAGARTLAIARAEGVVAADVLKLRIDATAEGNAVEARGSVGLANVERVGLPVQMKFSADGVEASVSGKVKAAWPTDGTDVQIDLRIEDARRLGAAVGVAAPRLPAIALSARLVGRDGALRAEPLDLALAANRVTGFVEVRDAKPRPKVDARLAASIIDLSQVVAQRREPERDEPTRPADGRVIPDVPLALPELSTFDGRLELDIGRLITADGAAVEKVAAKVSLAGGKLVADPVAAGAGSDRLVAKITLDASSPRSTGAGASVHQRGVTLGLLNAMLPKGLQDSGGTADLDIDLNGRGGSLRALLADLNGHVRIDLRNAMISGAFATLGDGVLARALGVLNPFAAKDDRANLKCAVVNVPVRGGVLATRQGVGIETDELVGTVSGRIDFGNEALDLNLRSESVGSLGPGLGDFAGAGRLTGTFAQPQIALHAGGAAELGVSVGAAAATGGATLLLGPLLRAAMPREPCRKAREATE